MTVGWWSDGLNLCSRVGVLAACYRIGLNCAALCSQGGSAGSSGRDYSRSSRSGA